jgi:hypothetical protein
MATLQIRGRTVIRFNANHVWGIEDALGWLSYVDHALTTTVMVH